MTSVIHAPALPHLTPSDQTLTLIKAGDHHPPSENRVFSAMEHRMNPRPVCIFEFVSCGPVEKTRALYLSRFSRGDLTKSSGQQISESQNLEFFASTSKFYNKSSTLFKIFSPNT